jgi:hypothetical protein
MNTKNKMCIEHTHESLGTRLQCTSKTLGLLKAFKTAKRPLGWLRALEASKYSIVLV